MSQFPSVPSSLPPLSVPAGMVPEMPERVPWSILGRDFIQDWGRSDPGKPQPEHVEVLGPTGSGKTYALATMMQQRAMVRRTSGIIIATKPADETLLSLGWPVVHDWRGIQQHRWSIFWPKTREMGAARRAYHEKAIRELLSRLWRPQANVMIQFGEVGYLESLSGDLKAIIQQYWREGRSQDITVLADKQRTQGVGREMHSETYWTAAFRQNDEDDMERTAQLFGPKRFWVPVMRTLDLGKREFLLRYSKTNVTFITWIDTPLRPVKLEGEGAGNRMYGRGRQTE